MNPNKKKILGFSISLGVLLILLCGALAAFFIIKPYDLNKGNYESEELKKYKEYYVLELDKKANEYYILGVKEAKQKVKSLTFPETIDNIPVTKVICSEDSFSSFMYISEIVISKNIKYIGVLTKDNIAYRDPFLLATGLSSFVVDEENEYFASVDGVLYSKDLKTLVRYPNAKDFGLGYVAFTIPDHVETILNHAFYLNDNLEGITFGKNVNKVGYEAFKNCTRLEDVTFNETLTELDRYSFSGCSSLNAITLPASLVIVGANTFTKCTKLRTIAINGEDTILDSAFSGIANLNHDPETQEPSDTHIYFEISNENTKMIENFQSESYLNNIGIGGLSGEFVYTTVYLNHIKGIVKDGTITYE